MANEFKLILQASIDQKKLIEQLNNISKNYKFNFTSNNESLKQAQDQIKKTQNDINNNSKKIKIFDAATTKAEIDKVKASFSSLQNDIKSIGNVSLKTGVDGGFTSAVVNYTNSLGLAAKQTMVMDKATGQWGASLSTTTEKVSAVTKNVNSFTDDMVRSISTTIRYATSIGVLYAALNQLTNGIQYIIDLNKEMTNIQLVTGQTTESLNTLAGQYNQTAKELGSTTLEVAKSSVEFIRQGRSAQETGELIKQSTMLQKLGNMEAADATEKLTAIMNGFNVEAENTSIIVDKLITLDNSFATSTKEISTAMQYSANSAQQAGVDFDHLAAYITVISSTTRQSAEMIGTSLRTMFSRLTDISRGNVLDAAGEDISRVEASLKRVGIDLRDGLHDFRDMQDVIADVGSMWEGLSETDKAFVSEQIAGIRQKEQFLTLMNKQTEIQKALNVQQESSGKAAQRYELFLKGIEARANKMKAALEGVWQETINSETIGQIYDGVTAILELIDSMGGLVPVITLAIGVLIAFNTELIKTKLIGASGLLTPLITAIRTFSFETIAATAATKGWGTALTGLSATNAVVLAITAVVLAIQAVNEQLVETNRLGVEANVDRWTQVFDAVKVSGGSAKESVEAFKNEISRIDKTIEDGGFAGSFVDRTSIVTNGLKQIQQEIKLTSKDYDEYKKLSVEAFEAAGLSVDEHGKVYKETADNIFEASEFTRIYLDNLEVLPAFEVAAARAAHQLTDEFIEQKKAIEAAADGMFTINTVLKGFQDSSSIVKDMLSKSVMGESFNFEDVQKLVDSNKDYLEFIEVIDGQIQINVEGLKEYDLQKARDILLTTEQEYAANGLTEAEIKQLDILRAYIRTLEDGSAYAEIYAEAEKKRAEEQKKRAEESKRIIEEEQRRQLDFLKEQADAAKKLLDMEIARIKQLKNDEKDHLRQQLDDYRNLIDARKDALDAKKAEQDYARSLKKDMKNVSDIRSQIAILQLDNSPEARAKILELEKQLADQLEQIADDKRDHRLDKQKDALDKEKEKFEKIIEDKIKKIDEYLDQTGRIAQDAMNNLLGNADSAYEKLIEWNRRYGSGFDQDVNMAWEKGYDVLHKYYDLLLQIEAITKRLATPTPTTPSTASPAPSSNTLGSGIGQLRIPTGQELGNLLGTSVNNNYQNSMNNIIPSIPKTSSNVNNNSGISIESLLTVNGNLERSLLPDVETMINKAIEKLNNINMQRGIRRPANLNSI